MTKQMSKLCKDCRYCKLNTFCESPMNGESLVTGAPTSLFALLNREDSKMCGKDANWFEPKPEEPKQHVTPWFKFWRRLYDKSL